MFALFLRRPEINNRGLPLGSTPILSKKWNNLLIIEPILDLEVPLDRAH